MAGHADPHRPALLNSDAAYLVNAMANKERQTRVRKGANGDLWSNLARLNEAREEPIQVAKVTAHASPAEVLRGAWDFADVIGNHLEDAAAGAAAERALEENEGARLVERWEARTFLIARRLAAIEAWHWQNGAEVLYEPPVPLQPWAPPVEEEVRNDIKGRITGNGHFLQKRGRESNLP